MLQRDQKCKVPTCSNDARTRMLCPKHYRRFLLYGDPEIQVKATKGSKTLCKIPHCSNPVQSGGVCSKHHRRFQKYGTYEASRLQKAPPGSLKKLQCKVAGCQSSPESSNHMMCSKHWQRFKKHGTTSNKVLVNLRSLPIKERLMRGIKKNKISGCWEWQKGLFSNGYGQISINGHGVGVHRISYSEFIGEIPKELQVLHECDNPICINPDHLFLGTQQDNMTDMVGKGRSAVATNKHAKLTKATVLFLRRQFKNGKSLQKFPEIYGVTLATIMNAVTGRTWKHVD